jgi:16S rRNA (guanine966-N2)-methyltransferase
LFAGTGQVGIEALSRGAARVVFVDSVIAAVRTIKMNLSVTGLTAGSEVRRADAFDYLRHFTGDPFDLIYIAPPQYRQLWELALQILDERVTLLLSPDGIAVVQIDPREFRELDLTGLRLFDQRRYGNTQLCFYQPN